MAIAAAMPAGPTYPLTGAYRAEPWVADATTSRWERVDSC